MKNGQTVYEFLNKMPDAEFDSKFLKLSRTDEFSAVASNVGTAQDIIKVKDDLAAAGVCRDWLEEDEHFYAIIWHITARLVNRIT